MVEKARGVLVGRGFGMLCFALDDALMCKPSLRFVLYDLVLRIGSKMNPNLLVVNSKNKRSKSLIIFSFLHDDFLCF